MLKLEVFFDYICPYCLQGYIDLLDLLPQYPHIEVEWHPCETHPRPESYRPHSDLCVRGMYAALEQGADLAEYHRRMYHAALKSFVDIEDINVLVSLTEGWLAGDELRQALSGHRYEDRLSENNRLAWEVYGFPAAPSYRMGGKSLESIPGVGVSKERLMMFLKGVTGVHHVE